MMARLIPALLCSLIFAVACSFPTPKKPIADWDYHTLYARWKHNPRVWFDDNGYMHITYTELAKALSIAGKADPQSRADQFYRKEIEVFVIEQCFRKANLHAKKRELEETRDKLRQAIERLKGPKELEWLNENGEKIAKLSKDLEQIERVMSDAEMLQSRITQEILAQVRGKPQDVRRVVYKLQSCT